MMPVTSDALSSVVPGLILLISLKATVVHHFSNSCWIMTDHMWSIEEGRLTEGAALVPCAVHCAIRLHLQIISMLAVQTSDNAFQLRLCKRNQWSDSYRVECTVGTDLPNRNREAKKV